MPSCTFPKDDEASWLALYQPERETGECFQSRLAIVLTQRCNLSCAHCMPSCSPDRTEDLREDAVLDIIRNAASFGFVNKISFTGGEPFLRHKTLVRAVEECSGLGLASTAITNASWAKTETAAKRMLNPLKALHRLGVSWDRFHARWVSLETIGRAIRIANELAIDTAVRISFTTKQEFLDLKDQVLEAAPGVGRIEAQAVIPVGRALREVPSFYALFPGADAACRVCDSPVIHPNGLVQACCGPDFENTASNPLTLGNVTTEGLGKILRKARTSPLLHMIRLYGPRWMFKWGGCSTALSFDEREHPCSVCWKMFNNIATSQRLAQMANCTEVEEIVATDLLLKFEEADYFETMALRQ